MDTGVAKAFVELWLAGSVMIPLSAQTCKAIDSINAGSTIVTGVDGTFINVDVTHFPYKKNKTELGKQLECHISYGSQNNFWINCFHLAVPCFSWNPRLKA